AEDVNISPAFCLPVKSFSQPTTDGETKPARLAMQLMAAMPAAAVIPPRNAVGNTQNWELEAMLPMAARLRSISADVTPLVAGSEKSATAASTIGNAQCSRLALVRSELMPMNGNAINAQR